MTLLKNFILEICIVLSYIIQNYVIEKVKIKQKIFYELLYSSMRKKAFVSKKRPIYIKNILLTLKVLRYFSLYYNH